MYTYFIYNLFNNVICILGGFIYLGQIIQLRSIMYSSMLFYKNPKITFIAHSL